MWRRTSAAVEIMEQSFISIIPMRHYPRLDGIVSRTGSFFTQILVKPMLEYMVTPIAFFGLFDIIVIR